MMIYPATPSSANRGTWPAGSVSAEEYPNITAVAHALPPVADPANFALAVDLMIEAIRGRVITGDR